MEPAPRTEARIDRSRARSLPRRNQPSLPLDRKSTRLNSSHSQISYAVFCLKKKNVVITTSMLGLPARRYGPCLDATLAWWCLQRKSWADRGRMTLVSCASGTGVLGYEGVVT